MAPWKQQYLSFGGRLTLVNSVLDGIPTYLMSLIPMPASLEKNIDKIRRQFLWEGNVEKRKFHLVKWSIVTKHKKEEGLGVRNLLTIKACYVNGYGG